MSDPDRLADWTLAEIKAGDYEPPEENPRQVQEIISWLVGEVERLRSRLALLEWAGCTSGGPQCPACGALKDAGSHRPGCELSAALRPERRSGPAPPAQG